MATKRTPQIPGAAPADAEQQPDEALAATPQDEPVQSALPRACDIDATKISRSVLTQDGWVCPA
jgi:hypothetical protein